MEFSRTESWRGELFLSPEDLRNPGIELRSPALWADSLPAEPQGKPKNTGVVSLSLLQGIFPTQESNHGLLHCRRIIYQLSHKGIPRILEWVAYPFSSRSSRSRNWTKVSCIAGRFFTNWAIKEAPKDLPAAAAAKSLQSCPTLCDTIDGSPPGSPVLGFSRQQHWSGLPFPSPMHESEEWKWSRLVVSDS